MDKNFLIILIFTFLIFAISVNASIIFIEVVNHETRECGYFDLGNYSLGNDGFTKIVLTRGWQFADSSVDWEKYCGSIGYAWAKEDIPYKIVLTPPIIIIAWLIIAGTIFLIIIQHKSRKNKRKSRKINDSV